MVSCSPGVVALHFSFYFLRFSFSCPLFSLLLSSTAFCTNISACVCVCVFVCVRLRVGVAPSPALCACQCCATLAGDISVRLHLFINGDAGESLTAFTHTHIKVRCPPPHHSPSSLSSPPLSTLHSRVNICHPLPHQGGEPTQELLSLCPVGSRMSTGASFRSRSRFLADHKKASATEMEVEIISESSCFLHAAISDNKLRRAGCLAAWQQKQFLERNANVAG